MRSFHRIIALLLTPLCLFFAAHAEGGTASAKDFEDVLPIGRHQVMGSEVHYVPEGKAGEMGWQTPVIMETYGFDDLKGIPHRETLC